ncbi:uncharacterized protein LOC108246840 isoform X2 [Kryptolebias marmoratus]|uniref:uncharacterized protein LOC108246840 isoform X2 n=1 Tax=Kryptolebias marmoratus TaxID=37003 RepID=UPI0018ACFC2F|nr:uncharacterized protein LOC108246840 isoform X2 [Kryptolebias marmoratus]
MSDMWTFSAATPPIVHHSSLSQSLPPLASTFRNHGNPPPTKVTSPHLCPPQVSSPHLCPPQVTSPHLCPPQVTSPHLCLTQVTSPHQSLPQVTSPNFAPQNQVSSFQFPQPQVTSPHLSPQMQVSSSHLFYQSQITSPHLSLPQVNSPHHLAPQVNCPLLHSPHVTSPNLVAHHQPSLYNQSSDPESDYTNWNKCESTSDLSCLFNEGNFIYQNQTSDLDLHLQTQTQFSTSEILHREELESTNKLYDTHGNHVSGTFDQSDSPGPGQHSWGPPVPTLSQVQCRLLGSTSSGGTVERWNSTDLSSSAQDFHNNNFFDERYHENNAQQPFCSPTTPGPSPHYPQTPAVSSPGPQMHPGADRKCFQKQTSTQQSRNHTSGYCLNEANSYLQISDPGQQHLHQTSQHHLMSQTELTEDLAGLLKCAENLETSSSSLETGPNVSTAGPTLGLPAALTHKEEGGRRGRRPRKGEDHRSDWAWAKQIQPERSTKPLNARCRLMCTVCNRDFKSLPALNGHMRSHSGFRSPTLLKKDTSPTASSPVSMVMPVSVPVQTRGMSEQRRCSLRPPAIGGAVLYHSLMHLEEQEDAVARGNKDGKVVITADLGRYTPPPMLCPQRAGSGLFCSLATRSQQRAQTIQLRNELGDPVASATACPPPGSLASGVVKPRINIGRSFQAEIPPLQDKNDAQTDSHNALLLWTPYDELEHPVNQQRVEALLLMARSSVVPGYRASPEYALQLLSEFQGDFLLTMERLLSTPETSNNQSGTGWSAAEKKLLIKSLQLHQKDFSSIQKTVRSKSLSECVEFYYLWKKKLNLNIKTQMDLTITLPEVDVRKTSKVCPRGALTSTQKGQKLNKTQEAS